MVSKENISLITTDAKKDKIIPKSNCKTRKLVATVAFGFFIFAVVCGYLSISVHSLNTENFALDDHSHYASGIEVNSSSTTSQNRTQKLRLNDSAQSAKNNTNSHGDLPVIVGVNLSDYSEQSTIATKALNLTNNSSDDGQVDDPNARYNDYSGSESYEGSDFQEDTFDQTEAKAQNSQDNSTISIDGVKEKNTSLPHGSDTKHFKESSEESEHNETAYQGPQVTTTTIQPFSNPRRRYEPPESQEPNFAESPDEFVVPQTHRPLHHMFRYEPPESQEPEYVPSESDEDELTQLNKTEDSWWHKTSILHAPIYAPREHENESHQTKSYIKRYEPPESQEPEYYEHSGSSEIDSTRFQFPYPTNSSDVMSESSFDANDSTAVKNTQQTLHDHEVSGLPSGPSSSSSSGNNGNSLNHFTGSYNTSRQDDGSGSTNGNTRNSWPSPTSTKKFLHLSNATDDSSSGSQSTEIQESDEANSLSIPTQPTTDVNLNTTTYVPPVEQGSGQ